MCFLPHFFCLKINIYSVFLFYFSLFFFSGLFILENKFYSDIILSKSILSKIFLFFTFYSFFIFTYLIFVNFSLLNLNLLIKPILFNIIIDTVFISFLELKRTNNRIKRVLTENNKNKVNEIEFKLQLLKEQLNPHFLFNALNVLKSLINIDQEKAIKYTIDLADLLRITIDSDKKDATIKEELELCQLYLSIQNIRFNNNIYFNVALNPEDKNYYIPFLTLIILIENAIKHNVISNQEKLFINLTLENDYLVLKNKLNKKHQNTFRKGTGLESINYRCKIMTNKQLEISENNQYFSIKIPFKIK